MIRKPMNLHRYRRPAARTVASALLLAGCGGERTAAGEGDRTVCFAFQDLETEFWVASHRAITRTLQEEGVEVIERNASQDANRQFEQVRDCLAQGVDAIIMIPQDGESAVTIAGEANRAGVPIGVYNRPPSSDRNPALVVVADNEQIAQKTVEYMAEVAREQGHKLTPLIMVGDLGDANAVARRKGFYNVIERNPQLFHAPVEVPTKWDAGTALANLEAALRANPQVDFLFTSSDFMLPQIRAVLEPLGKWKPSGQPGHVVMGGLDGDQEACRLIREGYLDATGVQDLFMEADTLTAEVLRAIRSGEQTPQRWISDPGFALTQRNYAERARDTWGCRLLEEGEVAAR